MGYVNGPTAAAAACACRNGKRSDLFALISLCVVASDEMLLLLMLMVMMKMIGIAEGGAYHVCINACA